MTEKAEPEKINILTYPILIGSSSNLVWSWGRGEFVALISNFDSKKRIKYHVLRKNASFHCFWSSTVSMYGHHGNKKRSIPKLLA